MNVHHNSPNACLLLASESFAMIPRACVVLTTSLESPSPIGGLHLAPYDSRTDWGLREGLSIMPEHRNRPLKVGLILPDTEREMGGATARWSDLAAMAR